jgi:DNA-binding response OmpR family regulator
MSFRQQLVSVRSPDTRLKQSDNGADIGRAGRSPTMPTAPGDNRRPGMPELRKTQAASAATGESQTGIIPAMAGERVLIVDDDAEIRETTGEYLSGHGFRTVLARDGREMRAACAEALPDLVLLDLNLPGEDGLSLTRWLRAHYDVPIIMVTGAGEVVDRVVGLELGADDYLAKPFDPRELRARLKSVLRRTKERPAAAAAGGAAPRRVKVGRCTLDLETHQLTDAAGAELPITGMEFDLLRVFVEHANRVLSRDQLLTLTRNREWEPFDRSIDIRIARLRRKLEADPAKPAVIRTVRGAGYMFVSG